jgi:hypothetical protein
MPIAGYHSSSYIGPIGGDELTHVYFDVDPIPLPSFDPPRIISRVKCTRANTPTGIQSGAAVVYDFGAADTDTTIDLTIPFCYPATLIKLRTLYANIAPVWFFDFHGNYYVKCAWSSLKTNVYQGTKDVSSLQIQLIALGSRLTSRGAE